MKPARIIVLCIAAFAAIGLALVVKAMMSPSREPSAPAAAAPVAARPVTKVLAAAKDLKPGQRLADGDLTWKDWPADQVDPAFITDGAVAPSPPKAETTTGKAGQAVKQAAVKMAGTGAKSDYVGAVVRETIRAGQPILERKIVRAGDSGYMAAYLEPGMRAMAIRVTVESAAGGFILPGDRVDVVLTRENSVPAPDGATTRPKFTTATVMKNIKVLAIDQTTRAGDDAQAVVGATATLEVAPADAEALALAKSEGDLSLALRSYADTAGMSGAVRVAAPQSSTVRIYRGGQAELASVQ